MTRREHTRRLIGEFLHDIKHQLGLITGANAVIKRDLEMGKQPKQCMEMTQITDEASKKIDQHLNLVTDNFTAEINADVLED